MISTKWFEVAIHSKPRDFLQLLRKNSYGSSKVAGFDLSYCKEDVITGRFIEEIRSSSTYTSPLGEQITNTVITHKIFAFAFFHRAGFQWLLRVDGNPRSLKSFTRLLSEILNFGFAIAQINTPVLDVLEHLQSKGMRTLQITSLFAANLPVGRYGLAKMEIRATVEGDAMIAFSRFAKVAHGIERLSAKIELDSFEGNLTVSKAGGISFDDEIEEPMVELYTSFLNSLNVNPAG